jgi:hypothetical protein
VEPLKPVTPEVIDQIKKLFEGLFHGPLPGDLAGGEGFFPLFPGSDELEKRLQKMVDTYNSNRWRYGAAVIMIRNAIEKVLDAVRQLLERVDYALDHYAPVVSLFRAASGWTAVMTSLSEIAGTVLRDIDNTSLRDWKDDARDKYSEDIVFHQQKAADAARGNAAYISNMLSEIGRSNTEFATGLVRTVAKVFAQVGQIALELASVVGSPFAIQDAAGLISEAIEGLAEMVMSAVDSFAAAVERIQNAENELSNHTYFPGGKWPVAVARA